MTRLYDRRVSVTLNDRRFDGDTVVAGQRLRGFRITFNVEHSIEEHGNRAEVTIENLSADSRGSVSARPRPQLILEAGYADATGLLFKGEATHVVHERTDTGFITRATVLSDLGAKRGIVNATLAPGASVGQAIKRVAEAMGVSAQRAIAQAIAGDFDGAKNTFVNGLTLSGPAGQLMDTFAKAGNFDWSVQNGELLLVPQGGFAENVAIVLGPTTGLIGSPQRVIDKKNPGRALIGAKSLLQPALTMGRKVILESAECRGQYKVVRAKHSGDTHGQAWWSEPEMIATSFVQPPPAPNVQPTAARGSA